MGILMTAGNWINEVAGVIGSLGFPIVMSLLLIKQNEKLEERHEKESQEFMKVIAANTAAIEKLSGLMTGKEM